MSWQLWLSLDSLYVVSVKERETCWSVTWTRLEANREFDVKIIRGELYQLPCFYEKLPRTCRYGGMCTCAQIFRGSVNSRGYVRDGEQVRFILSVFILLNISCAVGWLTYCLWFLLGSAQLWIRKIAAIITRSRRSIWSELPRNIGLKVSNLLSNSFVERFCRENARRKQVSQRISIKNTNTPTRLFHECYDVRLYNLVV